MTNEHALTQVALLRGMNVGGHRITNSELAQLFLDIGFAAAVPFQASGNVMLSGPLVEDPAPIEAALEAALGYAVPVMLRSAEQVAAIASASSSSLQLGGSSCMKSAFWRASSAR